MVEAKHKFDGRGSHRRAILHMIGQSIDVFKQAPTTAEVAAWMNVSKPTARKYLKKMVANGELSMDTIPYRSNAVKHTWRLTHDVLQNYKDGRLFWDYQVYASRVLKVIAL